jgi:hypothetical protein
MLYQGIDAGPCDAGNNGAVVRSGPALNRQLIGETGPARPLVLERNTNLRHRPPFRQEDALDRPVEAAGIAQTRDIPAPRDNLGFGAPRASSAAKQPRLLGRLLLPPKRPLNVG